MASIKGGLFVKGKSEEAISNNGAYFVDLTNATESSGTYTIPSADIENGDFTLQVGDLLVDKNSGNLLKVATLTPDITADLVVEESSGGGGGTQLYQHILRYSDQGGFIITDNDSTPINTYTRLKNYLSDNGFTSYVKVYPICMTIGGGYLFVYYGLYLDGVNIKRVGRSSNAGAFTEEIIDITTYVEVATIPL